MLRTYRTPKGTELPLRNLRGSEYLDVKYRLVWKMEEKPNWPIRTSFVELSENHAIARAEILNDEGSVMATAHKREDKSHFADFMEKAETGAVGRALAHIGFGTQFCADELDEGDRIVDGPVETKHSVRPGPNGGTQVVSHVVPVQGTGGDFVCSFGTKYKNLKVRAIVDQFGKPELQRYVAWLEETAAKKGMPLSAEAQFLKVNSERYFSEVLLEHAAARAGK